LSVRIARVVDLIADVAVRSSGASCVTGANGSIGVTLEGRASNRTAKAGLRAQPLASAVSAHKIVHTNSESRVRIIDGVTSATSTHRERRDAGAVNARGTVGANVTSCTPT